MQNNPFKKEFYSVDGGVLSLRLIETVEGSENEPPFYWWSIVENASGATVGKISLRIGYPDSLLYGGQIGYAVDEPYRGHGYAGAACRLLFPVMRAHGMRSAIITNNVENAASRRVCEKIGARFLCQTDIPEDHEMYKNGSRRVNVYALDAE